MSAPADGMVSLTGHDPEDYVAHALHDPERTYVETNCYTDIVIELLHARGCEPLAAMGPAVRIDFEGDQWTFLKPHPSDLESLYGLDIHEMQPYRPLPEQAVEQISNGRTIIVELDSWYLPDTAATSYRTEHVKSSVVIEAIDTASERMRYFHAAGLYELAGEDYRGVFREGRELSPDVLPPYTELVRFDAGDPLPDAELRPAARDLLRAHLAARPASNPFVRFHEALERDVPRLLDGEAADYHAYAFATVRMAGSAFEAAATMAEWLFAERAAQAAGSLRALVDSCKVLGFRLARRRPFDLAEPLGALGGAWEEAMGRLEDVAG